MTIRSAFGAMPTYPFNQGASDAASSITVPAATGQTVVTIYTVPANTIAILRSVYLLVDHTTSVSQALSECRTSRNGPMKIASLYSTPSTWGELSKTVTCEIILRPGQTVQHVYSNSDASAKTAQCYVIIDTFAL